MLLSGPSKQNQSCSVEVKKSDHYINPISFGLNLHGKMFKSNSPT